MIDINELRPAVEAAGLNAISMQEVLDLLDRLEAAESDALEQARLNGMGSEREAALMAKLEAAEKERDDVAQQLVQSEIGKRKISEERDAAELMSLALRAKVERMERQKKSVVGIFRDRDDIVNVLVGGFLLPTPYEAIKDVVGELPTSRTVPLYALPSAQPAPSVPEVWKLVPIEPTEKMINEGTCASTLPGPHYIDSACAKQCWVNMIAAAPKPEAKP